MFRDTGTGTLCAILSLCVIAVFGMPTQAAPKDGPRAGAGPDQRVVEGTQVILRGSALNVSGPTLRFAWTQVSGPRVTLRKANRSTANFLAPRVSGETALEFRLTVTDNRGRRASRVMKVTVVPRQQAKTSEAPAPENEEAAAR